MAYYDIGHGNAMVMVNGFRPKSEYQIVKIPKMTISCSFCVLSGYILTQPTPNWGST